MLQGCFETVSECPDYRDNPTGKSLFNCVLIWTVAFLRHRLDASSATAPYLFEKTGGEQAKESDLQSDYHQFLSSVIVTTEVEVRNVGGGRADVRCTYRNERLVVEIKREGSDSSFDGLAAAYEDQATDYQATGIRLGILLVLDQTERRKGTPHMSSLVQVRTVTRKDELHPRWLTVVKVPGRRLSPSDLTKVAKAATKNRQ